MNSTKTRVAELLSKSNRLACHEAVKICLQAKNQPPKQLFLELAKQGCRWCKEGTPNAYLQLPDGSIGYPNSNEEVAKLLESVWERMNMPVTYQINEADSLNFKKLQ